MAKHLLLNVLTNVLGDFVDGLSSENLRMGVWSGEIEFHSLSLNTKALDFIELPVKVKYGKLEYLKIAIPWKNLLGGKISINIGDVSIALSPRNPELLSSTDKHLLSQKLREYILKSIEIKTVESFFSKFIPYLASDIRHSSKGAPISGFMKTLLKKIFSNISIEIANLHICYEDNFSVDSLSINAGISLKSVSFSSYNSKVVNEKASSRKWINKSLAFSSIYVYVSEGKIFKSLDPSFFESEMVTHLDQQIELNNCIVHENTPFSIVFSLSFPRSSGNSKSVDKKNVVDNEEIQWENIRLVLFGNLFKLRAVMSKRQIEYMSIIVSSWNNYLSRISYFVNRPNESPLINPRSWWLYAANAISGKEVLRCQKNKIEESISSNRFRYILLLIRLFVSKSIEDFPWAFQIVDRIFGNTLFLKSLVRVIVLSSDNTQLKSKKFSIDINILKKFGLSKSKNPLNSELEQVILSPEEEEMFFKMNLRGHLTGKERNELEHIESQLPFGLVRYFRQLAVIEVFHGLLSYINRKKLSGILPSSTSSGILLSDSISLGDDRDLKAKKKPSMKKKLSKFFFGSKSSDLKEDLGSMDEINSHIANDGNNQIEDSHEEDASKGSICESDETGKHFLTSRYWNIHHADSRSSQSIDQPRNFRFSTKNLMELYGHASVNKNSEEDISLEYLTEQVNDYDEIHEEETSKENAIFIGQGANDQLLFNILESVSKNESIFNIHFLVDFQLVVKNDTQNVLKASMEMKLQSKFSFEAIDCHLSVEKLVVESLMQEGYSKKMIEFLAVGDSLSVIDVMLGISRRRAGTGGSNFEKKNNFLGWNGAGSGLSTKHMKVKQSSGYELVGSVSIGNVNIVLLPDVVGEIISLLNPISFVVSSRNIYTPTLTSIFDHIAHVGWKRGSLESDTMEKRTFIDYFSFLEIPVEFSSFLRVLISPYREFLFCSLFPEGLAQLFSSHDLRVSLKEVDIRIPVDDSPLHESICIKLSDISADFSPLSAKSWSSFVGKFLIQGVDVSSLSVVSSSLKKRFIIPPFPVEMDAIFNIPEMFLSFGRNSFSTSGNGAGDEIISGVQINIRVISDLCFILSIENLEVIVSVFSKLMSDVKKILVHRDERVEINNRPISTPFGIETAKDPSIFTSLSNLEQKLLICETDTCFSNNFFSIEDAIMTYFLSLGCSGPKMSPIGCATCNNYFNPFFARDIYKNKDVLLQDIGIEVCGIKIEIPYFQDDSIENRTGSLSDLLVQEYLDSLSVDINLKKIDLDIKCRNHDLLLNMKLADVSMIDGNINKRKTVLSTADQGSSERGNFLELSVIQLFDKKSKFLETCDSHCVMISGVANPILLSLDASIFLFLRDHIRILANLFQSVFVSQPQPALQLQANSLPLVPSFMTKFEDISTIKNFSFNCTEKSWMKSDFLITKLNIQLEKVDLASPGPFDPFNLERISCDPVVEIELTSIRSKFSMKESIETLVSIEDIIIFDSRAFSVNNIYRILLSSNKPDDSYDDELKSLSEGDGENNMKMLTSKEVELEDNVNPIVLSLKGKWDNLAAEFFVSDMLFRASIDLLMDVGNLLLNFLYAALFSIGMPPYDTGFSNQDYWSQLSRNGCSSSFTSNSNSKTKPTAENRVNFPWKDFSIEMNVVFHNLTVLLLEDPGIRSCSSIGAFLKTVTLSSNYKLVNNQQLSSETFLKLKLNDISLFSFVDTSDALKTPTGTKNMNIQQSGERFLFNHVNICDFAPSKSSIVTDRYLRLSQPFDVSFSFYSHRVNGVVINVSVGLVMQAARFFIAPSHIPVFSKILTRKSMSGVSNFRYYSDAWFCICGSNLSDSGTQLDIFQLACNFGDVDVLIINDLVVPDGEPFLQFCLRECSIQADGLLRFRLFLGCNDIRFDIWANDFQLSASFSFFLNFYHLQACQWEPVLEKCSIDLEGRKGIQGLTVEVLMPNRLSVNVSGKLLEGIIGLIAEYQRLDKEDLMYSRYSSKNREVALLDQGIESDSLMVNSNVPKSSKTYEIIFKSALLNVLNLDMVVSSQEQYVLNKKCDVQPGESWSIKDLVFSDPFFSISATFYGYYCSGNANFFLKKNAMHYLNLTKDVRNAVEFEIPDIRLCLAVELNQDEKLQCDTIEIVVFSKYLFLDRSGLKLCAKSSWSGRSSPVINVGVQPFVTASPFNKKFVENIGKEYLAKLRKESNSLPLEITHFKTTSRRNYSIVDKLSIGISVFSDREMKWSFLPKIFQNQKYIMTACDDHGFRSKELIELAVNRSTLLFILVEADFDEDGVSKWMIEHQFSRHLDICIASEGVNSGSSFFFTSWYRFLANDEIVMLGGLDGNKKSAFMYSLVVMDILDPDFDEALVENLLGSALVSSNNPSNIEGISTKLIVNDPSNYSVMNSNGVSYFHTDNDKVNISLNRDIGSWSSDLDLSIDMNEKKFIEIKDKLNSNFHQVSWTCQYLPGIFYRTRVITCFPKYCIVNAMDTVIQIGLVDHLDDPVDIEPYESIPWHCSFGSKNSKILLRTVGTEWSHGCLDVNEVGTSVFLLPSQEWFSGSINKNCTVANVDVRISERENNSMITIVVWKATHVNTSLFSVKNESFLPISVRQCRESNSSPRTPSFDKYSLCIVPGSWSPFGWADPNIGADINIMLGTPPFDSNVKSTKISFLKLNYVHKISTNIVNSTDKNSTMSDKESFIYFSVQALGNGRVLRIVDNVHDLDRSIRISDEIINAEQQGAMSSTTKGALVASAVMGSLVLGPFAGLFLVGGAAIAITKSIRDGTMARNKIEEASNDIIREQAKMLTNNSNKEDNGVSASQQSFGMEFSIILNISIKQIAVSLFVELPIRREFLCLYLDDLDGKIRANNSALSVELSVDDIQLDIYSETRIFPVVLSVIKDEQSRDLHAAEFILVQEWHLDSTMPHYKYVAVRVLEMRIKLDSASLQLLVSDLGYNFPFNPSGSNALANNLPHKWAEEFLMKSYSPIHRSGFVDISSSFKSSLSSKLYIENLVLHPIKVNLSFQQTFCPRNIIDISALVVLSYIPAFASMENATLKVDSFIVADVFESKESLSSRILMSALQNLQLQLGRLAGSLNMLGQPIGLFKNIGGGVQALFYEPYQGAMQSPKTFFVGLVKGAGSLVGGVVSGALGSTAAIVGTTSQGISQGYSYISGDEKFAIKRSKQKRRALEAAQEGLLSGIIEGGRQAGHGVVAGVKGLIWKPIKEARQDGALGFLRGIGLGVVGAAVQPVLGVTDGFTSVAQSIIYKVNINKETRQRRSSRPLKLFQCVNGLVSFQKLIISFDAVGVIAQDVVVSRSKSRGEMDEFVDFCRLSANMANEDAIFLSNKYIFLRRMKESSENILDQDDSLEKEYSIVHYRWSIISHCIWKEKSSAINIMTLTEIVPVNCSSITVAEKVFRMLSENSWRAKFPMYFSPRLGIEAQGDQYSEIFRFSLVSKNNDKAFWSTFQPKDARLYRFGSANYWRESVLSWDDNAKLSTDQIMDTIFSSLESHLDELSSLLSTLHDSRMTCDVIWRRLDEIMWEFVCEWDVFAKNRRLPRCTICTIINESSEYIQILETALLYGRDLRIFPCFGFNSANRVLYRGGCVIIIVLAHRSVLNHQGHAKANIKLSCCSLTLSTRRITIDKVFVNTARATFINGDNKSILSTNENNELANEVMMTHHSTEDNEDNEGYKQSESHEVLTNAIIEEARILENSADSIWRKGVILLS